MDNRRLLLVMLIAIPLVILWPSIVDFVGRQLGYDMTPRKPTTQMASATQPGLAGAPAAPLQTDVAGVAGPVRVTAAGESRVVQIGSERPNDPSYAIGVKLNSRGAGIEAVTLNQYRDAVGSERRYVFQTPSAAFPDASRPLASGEIRGTVGGQAFAADLARVDWRVQSATADTVTFVAELAVNNQPALRVQKTYRLATIAESRQQARGYEVAIQQTFESLTDQPIILAHDFIGPVMPPRELDRGSDRNVIAGYVEGPQSIKLRHDYLESFSAKQPTIDYTRGPGDLPILWAGTASVYFNATLRPDVLHGTPPGAISPGYIAKVQARLLDPDNPDSHGHHVVTQFHTTELAIAPGGTLTIPMRLFVGPRLRSLLNNDYLSSLPFKYDETLVLTSGPCAFCTFQWLVNVLVWMLGGFHFVLRDWGLAIIALVLVVRALLHPITKKSQVNMMKMSKFGPEIERLKKKYGDNQQELQKAMMQFYKEHGATPILGCLPMFLQMPIWIALFSALQSTFELRQAPFLQFGSIKLTWISDLSQPDHLIKLDQPFTLLGLIPVSGLNILPFLLAVVFWLQYKYTPKPPSMTPEQLQQQKMMQWMTLLFPVFLYGGPSGLNLYILASTAFGILESKIIRDHIKKKEEAEQQGVVIVDAPDGAAPTQRKKDRAARPAEAPAAPRGWLARKMEEARRRVEELQRQAEKQQRRKRT